MSEASEGREVVPREECKKDLEIKEPQLKKVPDTPPVIRLPCCPVRKSYLTFFSRKKKLQQKQQRRE